eukprot:CAMPEP_0176448608 /NCGR_PEP_ID=MMETSP0127-20121128/25898_1 /TAXON_ID=938130 /ORGANISM="Platyophrya macrostoma, Strain WH" /LENGTH=279 /DNA_ID=CAMNT_0017835617 /DNA_START=183 /DNA_END=1022 /DNA_ORIENTATION=-
MLLKKPSSSMLSGKPTKTHFGIASGPLLMAPSSTISITSSGSLSNQLQTMSRSNLVRNDLSLNNAAKLAQKVISTGSFGTTLEVTSQEIEIKSSTSQRYVHYIIAVDSSGSMQSRWSSLKNSLRDVLNEIHNVNPDNRISIISFSSSCKLDLTYVKPREALLAVNNLTYFGAGTDFSNPLEVTSELIQKYPMASTLIFMSDGEAEYPKKAVTKLLDALKSMKHYMYLFVIGIECQMVDVLERMRKAFHGKYEFNVKTSDIGNTLIKIVQTTVTITTKSK